nr:(2Fe-2S)-binding protein [Kitasatospora purpeofusca]
MSAHSTRPTTPVATAVGRTGPGTGPAGPAAATSLGTAFTTATGTVTSTFTATGTFTAAGPAAYRRLGEVLPALRVRCAPPRSGRGWLAGADLVARPAALRELISHDARQGLARYGRPLRPDVAAGIGLHRFVWPAALLFTLPWFLERRVPLLAPGDIAVRRRTGELTVRPGAFLCLPDDPAAPGPAPLPTAVLAAVPAPPPPGARAVPDEAALATGLRSALADFLTPVLDAFRPEVRRGPRTLWAMATDAVVEGLWYAGGLLGEEERARTELAALFAPGASEQPEPRAARPAPECAPFTPGAGFTAPASGGTERSDRCRASCCLVYTARAEAMCTGCPRVARG